MITKKLFIASSSELKNDLEQFEILVNRKNKDWVAKGVFLDLVIWDDILDAMSQTRLQDEYNKAIRECDLFVMLYWTKVGQYTEEEFETAFGQFKSTNKPFIFTYFKDAEISVASANKKDLMSLWAFQEKLSTLGHFYTIFKNVDELKFKFNQQLDKLAANGFFEFDLRKDQTAAPPAAQATMMKGSVAGVVGGVFISYRRDDAAFAARSIYERLVGALGRETVFFDIDSMKLGFDFVEALSKSVGNCDALVAVIGKRWATKASTRTTDAGSTILTTMCGWKSRPPFCETFPSSRFSSTGHHPPDPANCRTA